jgi:hypothetical protein
LRGREKEVRKGEEMAEGCMEGRWVRERVGKGDGRWEMERVERRGV